MGLNHFLGGVLIAGLIAFLFGSIALLVRGQRHEVERKFAAIRNLGYDFLVQSVNCPFIIKDGGMYFSLNLDSRRIVPIEITGVNQITRNANLVAVEVRYRTSDGRVTSYTVNRLSKDDMLTLMDKLGYGG